VAYVVGDAFFPDGSGHNTMRLNFSYSDDEMLTEGIRRLAEAIKEEMASFDLEETIMAELI
jgi:DNA-binding transcriptional MocR family regulator